MSKELKILEELINRDSYSLEFQEKLDECLMKQFIIDFGLDQPKQLDMWKEFGTGL